MLRIPQLALKRLVIQSRGVTVYDEQFRLGVSIIRGTNSSGKSTIADFIFYVLGGEVAKFKPEAERCEEVLAEIQVNGKLLTLRRIIKPGGKQSILIFYGDFQAAMASPVTGWQVYSMVRSANKESFSQMFISLLGLPEVKTETDNSITMHQLLRLIYIDQLSPVDALLRFESFDPTPVRQGVGDLLFGLYDDNLYNELYELREKTKNLEVVSEKLEGLYRAVRETGIEIDEAILETRITEIANQLSEIERRLAEQASDALTQVTSPDVKVKIESLADELRKQKIAISEAATVIGSLELEIADSEAFIAELKSRIASIDDSLTTRQSFGELPLTHCPHCLSVLHARTDTRLCALCGNELPESPTDSRALRMKQELSQQLKESQKLLVDKSQALTRLQTKIPDLRASLNATQRRYEQAVQQVRPPRDQRIDNLLVQKGELTAEVENITKQKKLAALLKSYELQKAALQASVLSLGISIEGRKRAQLEKRFLADQTVERNVLFLLKNDLPREEMFQSGTKVTVDFGKNTFWLDGRNQFSASSVVYLKNSVHFAIFFASLELDFFRYPRFIICDNMEDKGMEQERSRHFQKLIVKLSEESQIQHQIIFTTSMIDPSLNNDKYCIGPEYNEHRKSLDFGKLKPS